MNLQRGFPLLYQQYKALLKKNLLLSWRNRTATFLQLFASLLFVFLIFAIQKAFESRFASSTLYRSVTDPESLVSPPIPPCESKFYVKLPCHDFVWSGNGSARVRSIVDAIRANNPGRAIPEDKVLSFRTSHELESHLFDNPMTCPGALHFMDRNATVIGYGIQTNSTPLAKRGVSEDPTFKFQIPLQIAAEREIARSLLGVPNFSWVVSLLEFAHPAQEIFSAMRTVGPTFFLAAAMFGFVFQISTLISEKELKLRQAMTIMGVFDSAYWFSWFTWEGFLTLLSSLFIVLFGMMFQFDFFLKNSFGVVFLVFFLFQINMLGFAMLFSMFIEKAESSTTVGFYTFIIGFLTQLVTVFGFPYNDSIDIQYRVIWSLFPPNLLAKALDLLASATSTPQDKGISWSRIAECPQNDDNCVITISDLYKWLAGTFILWFVLAVYFDNVIRNASGVRKSMLYFLKPGYWTGKGGNKVEDSGIFSCCNGSSSPRVELNTPDDEDVQEEENLVKQQSREGLDDPSIAVQIRGLMKTYPGSVNIGCFKCKKKAPYHAIKGLWMNFAKDQLFCLLGPNGAGKTTTINCLTGITPVTGGDALIYGQSIRSSIGMSKSRKLIGVCPQFDILWGLLSAREHLQLFASIKGLPPSSINSIVEKSIADVKLTEAAKVRAGSYSGGMKRRLSVAIALIGDPKLVILDEPTTGMDPITRRHVWDIIEDAKKGRAIILTTHSMEEADILGDRIGIMAKGRLRCIGTSIRLKSRFGTGFIANVSFSSSNGQTPPESNIVNTTHHEAVKQFFKHHLDVVPQEESKSVLTFVIPHDKETALPNFFTELQDREKEFGITDIQLGLATLEEVFLNIARQAELEDATSEGRLVPLTLTSSGTSMKIPVGARFVGIPGTECAETPRGLMVEVYWNQDDSGALCVSGHSDEMPIPLSVEPMPNSAPIPNRRTFGRRPKVLRGVVLDAHQILSSMSRSRSRSRSWSRN